MVTAIPSNIIIICVLRGRFGCIPTFFSNNKKVVHLTQWCSLLSPLCHIMMQPWRRLGRLHGCNTAWLCSGAAVSPCVMFFVSSGACNSQTQCSCRDPSWPAKAICPQWNLWIPTHTWWACAPVFLHHADYGANMLHLSASHWKRILRSWQLINHDQLNSKYLEIPNVCPVNHAIKMFILDAFHDPTCSRKP